MLFVSQYKISKSSKNNYFGKGEWSSKNIGCLKTWCVLNQCPKTLGVQKHGVSEDMGCLKNRVTMVNCC